MSPKFSRVAFAIALVPFLVAAAHAAKPKHVAPAPSGPPEVLFTFDDGPNLERTPKVLDVLDKHHIKAIFFVNGWHFQGTSPEAEKSRALLREIVRRGHAVGNHTVHHYFLCGKLGKKVAAQEIELNADLIEKAIGMRPELFRTPYGSKCAALSQTLASVGVTPIGWDIDPQDWRVKNTQIVRDYVIRSLRNLHGRAIVLFHDVHEDTVRALPQVLDWLDGENAARTRRGETPVKILDYAYLLPPHPSFPPLLEGIGRVLIDTHFPPKARRSLGNALRLLGIDLPHPGTS
jgi:peptidoglycan/xylan/chitin deacetylase (PgdA/CDA1 family)